MQLRSFLRPAAAAAGAGQGRIWPLYNLPGSTATTVSQETAQSTRFSSSLGDRACTALYASGAASRILSPVQVRGSFVSSSSIRSMSTNEVPTSTSASGVKDLKTAEDVLGFWYVDEDRVASDEEFAKERNGRWWGFGPKDQDFIDIQLASKGLIEKAANGELTGGDWDGPRGALARVLLLDQFPRTAYRGTTQAFATDEKAAKVAREIIEKGWDTNGEYKFFHRTFLYVPLMHSEDLSTQELCTKKCEELYEEEVAAKGKANPAQRDMAHEHCKVIAKFGRFPHRNDPLGRESTTEEEEWLKSEDVPGWAKSQMSSPS